MASLTNGETEELTLDSDGDKLYTADFNTSPTLTAVDYVVSALATDKGNPYHTVWLYYDTGDTNQGHYTTTNISYTSFPNPLSTYDHNTDKYSLYVTYTAAAAGTNMKINIADDFKDVAEMQINIGDVWKDITQAKINIGDSWKTIFG